MNGHTRIAYAENTIFWEINKPVTLMEQLYILLEYFVNPQIELSLILYVLGYAFLLQKV